MRKNNDAIIKNLFLFLIFSLGIVLGLLLWNNITLPFHNPWGVTGNLTIIKFNPANNIVRFIVLIFFPALLLSIIYMCNVKKVKRFWIKKPAIVPDYYNTLSNLPNKARILYSSIIFIFLCFIILFTIILYYYTEITCVFDTFHEGETLGTGISYLAGKIPYKDFIFCHGVYQDPLRSAIAFSLFGKSIVSVRILEAITQIISLVLLFILIIKIFHKDWVLSFLSIIILYFSTVSFFIFLIFPLFPNSLAAINYSRDITTYSFLIAITFIQKLIIQKDVSTVKLCIVAFFFSFIPIAAFGYSIDRGLYLAAAYIIISLILYFFFYRRSTFRIYYLISSLSGILSALALLFMMLRGNFTEFIKFTFLVMPKYKELLDGGVYPIFEFKYMFICVLIAFNVYWMTYKFIQEYHQNNKQFTITISNFLKKYLIEFCLLLLSIFFYRSALGRIDWGHFIYSSPLTYLLTIYILFKHYMYRFLSKKVIKYIVVGLVIVYSYSFTVVSYKLITTSETAPYKIEDSTLIPDNYKATISYLKNNLGSDENFFTMTSEACWYYFIGKACPTRFPVVWFAAPYFYQEEIIKDLQKNNVKFILYKNDMWSNAVDGFDNETRFPIIMNYIKQNYIFHKKIDDNEIWINKRLMRLL